VERIREEINKCLMFDTKKTLRILISPDFGLLFNEVFNERTKIWLEATTKEK
jgi:hypothetical protein